MISIRWYLSDGGDVTIARMELEHKTNEVILSHGYFTHDLSSINVHLYVTYIVNYLDIYAKRDEESLTFVGHGVSQRN